MNVTRLVPRPTRIPSKRGFAVGALVLAVVLLSGSLRFSRHGVSVVACGDLAADCVQL